jgi:hypothetical protein
LALFSFSAHVYIRPFQATSNEGGLANSPVEVLANSPVEVLAKGQANHIQGMSDVPLVGAGKVPIFIPVVVKPGAGAITLFWASKSAIAGETHPNPGFIANANTSNVNFVSIFRVASAQWPVSVAVVFHSAGVCNNPKGERSEQENP